MSPFLRAAMARSLDEREARLVAARGSALPACRDVSDEQVAAFTAAPRLSREVVTPLELKAMETMRADGYTDTEIARRLGRNQKTVTRRLMPPAADWEALRAAAVESDQRGVLRTVIAERLGVSRQRLGRMLRGRRR